MEKSACIEMIFTELDFYDRFFAAKKAGFKSIEGRIIANIRDFHEYFGYIHVAGAPGRMESGTGKINFKKVFETLQEVGYLGPIGFELNPSKSSEEVAQELLSIY